MMEWMTQLHSHLLSNQLFTDDRKQQFASLVQDIWGNWIAVTGRKPTPKSHILIHALEFVFHHHNLGQFSESPVESYHHTHNRTMARHINCGKKAAEQHRRALADTCVQAATAQHAPQVKPRFCRTCHLPIKKSHSAPFCQCNPNKYQRSQL